MFETRDLVYFIFMDDNSYYLIKMIIFELLARCLIYTINLKNVIILISNKQNVPTQKT